jgi:hypothetical protein
MHVRGSGTTCQCLCLVQKCPPPDMEDSKKGYPIVLGWFGCSQENGGDGISEKNYSESNRKHKSSSISQFYPSYLMKETQQKWARQVTEQTLDPYKEGLYIRLQENLVRHPIMSKVKHPCCSLCMLVSPNKNHCIYHDVYSCNKCNVDLCIPGFLAISYNIQCYVSTHQGEE